MVAGLKLNVFMKRLLFIFSVLLASAVTMSATGPDGEKKTGKNVREELESHVKVYGFIRNFFPFDSRESASGTGNLFYYLPFDHDYDSDGNDLNDSPSFRFLSITSRVGLDVLGYRVGKMDISAKVETDFYAGLSGSTGTAIMRLRQAYLKLGWSALPMCGGGKASVSLLMGQAWHPMAADQPDVIGLATGAPFNPFNRSPQVTVEANLGTHFTITGALVYQMQYASVGPDGASADYMKYGLLPEAYAAVSYKSGGFLAKAGVSVLSIKPYNAYEIPGTGSMPAERYRTSGRMTAVSPYLYLQYKEGNFTLKAKTVYGGAADYLNLVSGYGVTSVGDDWHLEYAPTYTSSSWLSLSYGKKVQGMFMAGYMNNLGAAKDFMDDGEAYWFFSKDGGNFKNLAQAFRVVPAVIWNIGKFALGLEYEVTAVQYGSNRNMNGSVMADGQVLPDGTIAERHWVANHRVQLMTRFNF